MSPKAYNRKLQTSFMCESNDKKIVTCNSLLVGKFSDQNLDLKYKVALYREMKEACGQILLNLLWNMPP
jgi:hypothetical protein